MDNKSNGVFIIFLLFSGITPPNLVTISAQNNEAQFNDQSFFNVTILLPVTTDFERFMSVNLIVDSFNQLGINTELINVGIGEVVDRTIFNDDIPVPLFEEDGYDIYALGVGRDKVHNWNYFGFNDWNLVGNPNYPIEYVEGNHTNYANKQYWSFISDYYAEFDVERRMEIFDSMQDLLYQDLPITGLYTHPDLILQSSDINLTSAQIKAFYAVASPSMIKDLETTNVDDTITIHGFWNTYNPLAYDDVVLQLMFQPLYEAKVGDPMTWQPLLAESMPVWNENFTVAQIQLRDDVFFSDGEQFNAYDVNATYAWYLHNDDRNNIVRGSDKPLFDHYLNVTEPLKIIDDFTVEFHFSEPFVFGMNLFRNEIIPSHLMSMANMTGLDFNEVIFRDLLENNTSELLVGTGPFLFDDFVYNGSSSSFRFVANPSYWNGTAKTSNIEFLYIHPREDFPQIIASGRIDLAKLTGVRYSDLYNTKHLEELAGLSYSTSSANSIQVLGFNLQHPVFGNGSSTPLGMKNPDRALEAAKYVRYAMNHAIPRPAITEAILQNGTIDPIYLKMVQNSIIPSTYGYNSSKPLLEYDLSKAREYLEKAGYKHEDDSDIQTPVNNNSNNILFLVTEGIAISIVIMVLFYKKSLSDRVGRYDWRGRS